MPDDPLINERSTNGNGGSHADSEDYEMSNESQNSDETEAPEEPTRWLEYPLEIESYKSRFFLPDANN